MRETASSQHRNLEKLVNRIPADPGLRNRLRRAARRVADQHHAIADFHRILSDELTTRSKSQIRIELDRYRTALSAHFDLEEQIFFPTVRSADVGQTALIRQLIESHSRMRRELSHLGDSIESHTAEEFSARLAGFQTILASHERQEENLLARVLEFPARERKSAAPD